MTYMSSERIDFRVIISEFNKIYFRLLILKTRQFSKNFKEEKGFSHMMLNLLGNINSFLITEK